MRSDSAPRLRQLKTLRQVEGQDRRIGKDRLTLIKQKLQAFRVHGDDEVDLALAVALAHQVQQKPSIFRARITYQVQVLIELISDAYPTGLQCG